MKDCYDSKCNGWCDHKSLAQIVIDNFLGSFTTIYLSDKTEVAFPLASMF